ncbi:MAG: glycosyltransferase family 1 protein [Candidatus Portnoybacteria bacterium]|nr:glycosyltransferase family 1 protein [Candidatus Portnoybacteria bacterium]MDD4982550.1 glycosyltransferase family 1 protein [Candidatus Portnoybacteria bacterium]
MRIGIDARFFGPKAKGLGRYAQKLIEELEKNDDQNDYTVFLQRADFKAWQPKNQRFKKVLADYRWYSLVEQLFFPFKIYAQKIDLMHFTHFNAPVLYFKPYVVTIHDLILQKFPTAKNSLFGRFKYFFKSIGYKIVISLVLARAEKIIAVSQFVKDDIIRSFGAPEEKVRVIYEGVPILDNSKGPTADSRGVLEKYKIKKPYLLYVGNAYPHKNLLRLAEAFKILRNKNYVELELVLVGGEDYFYKKLKQENCDSDGICFGGGVVFAGFVPDKELEALYQNAKAYVFPSLCEGFGLPPLEAMAYGAPVVSSSATCLPEILGETTHYFDAQNPSDIAQKINEVLTDENLRQKLIAQGFERIKKYSWRKMAEETAGVYSNIDGRAL